MKKKMRTRIEAAMEVMLKACIPQGLGLREQKSLQVNPAAGQLCSSLIVKGTHFVAQSHSCMIAMGPGADSCLRRLDGP
jgi:hypothetical protein